MPTVRRPHATIAYEVVGSGPPVMLGHSLFCTRNMWAGVVNALASEYCFINVDLSSVRVPTLVIVGKHDTPTPLPCAQAIADTIEGAALVVIPGAGHLTTVEQPATVVEHLRPFFARCVIGQSS